MSAISVVLGTYNRIASLQRTVESVFRETRSPVRVYVTDAGSSDGTVEWLRSVSSERLVPFLVGKRLGQARAYNDVFRQVHTPYVCWLSDDNEVVNAGLDEAERALEERPDLGMIALKVKDVLGPFTRAPYIGGVSSIGVLNVNQGMLRTPVLQALGGFSEEFRDYGIDPDLTLRVLLAGHAVAYTRRIALLHYRDWGPGPDSEQFREQMKRQERYQERYHQKYGALARAAIAWRGKRLAWAALRRLLPATALESERMFLGGCPRDWQNAFCSRYVSLLDPLRYARRRYHLVQKIS
jgi:GT2 family glycosyltransferase